MLQIIISNASDKPIYEQIASQIRAEIAEQHLMAGEMLPSMRQLARDLRVSLITTKRAYEELERTGFIETVPGKGCFVAPQNLEVLREAARGHIEAHLTEASEQAKRAGIPLDEVQEMLELIFKGDAL